MRASSVELPSGPIHWVDFGGHGRTFVLVHGLGGAVQNWQSLGPALAERARVVALDLAGFGLSPLAKRTGHVEQNRKVLSEFLNSVAPGPVTLVGNSMGGLISLYEAADEPERVEGLVLLDPAIPAPKGIEQDRQVVLVFTLYSLPFVGEWVMKRFAKAGVERSVRDTFKLCCVNPDAVAREVYEAHVELARERARKAPWSRKAYLAAARSITAMMRKPQKFSARVQNIRARTLVIHGEKDRLVPVGSVKALCAEHPGWELEVLPNIGHMPMLEAPAQVAQRIFRWLDAAPKR